jgi:uncharacterized repeat protein (TIGR03803 family)
MLVAGMLAALTASMFVTAPAHCQTFQLNLQASFNGPGQSNDGAYPAGPLITDGNGNFFGVTNGGNYAYGDKIVEYSASGGIQVLAAFPYNTQTGQMPLGQNPNGGLVRDSSGNLYGTAYLGGANGGGTIFEYSTSGGLVALASFTTVTPGTGYYPRGGLITDGSGHFYGTTSAGGASGDGTIFKYSASGGIQPEFDSCA